MSIPRGYEFLCKNSFKKMVCNWLSWHESLCNLSRGIWQNVPCCARACLCKSARESNPGNRKQKRWRKSSTITSFRMPVISAMPRSVPPANTEPTLQPPPLCFLGSSPALLPLPSEAPHKLRARAARDQQLGLSERPLPEGVPPAIPLTPHFKVSRHGLTSEAVVFYSKSLS